MFTSRLQNERTDMLAQAFLSLETQEDCYRLFEDLFTIREIQDLTQRLEVAQLLQNKTTYTDIVERTGVSTATIGRVNRALNYGAGGYQRVLEKLNKKDTDE
ncbi:MAG: TrpR-like protein YerC/YecD [Clostridia bacterium]|nr:TrpR-like protein YerC/YecD [Clostridia bacterium]